MAALVQTTSGTSASSASLTLTLGSNSTSGNCLVVAIGFLGATTSPTAGTITLGGVAGNFSNRIFESLSGVCSSGIWVCENIASGQTSIAITLTGGVGSVGMFAYAWEFSGISTSAGAAVDKSAGQSVNTPASTFTSTATATTTSATEAWVGIGAVAAGGTPTLGGPSSPWANLTGLNGTIGGVNAGSVAGAQIRSSTGAATYSGTISSTENFSACVLTLLPSIGTITGAAALAGAGVVTAAGGSSSPPGTPQPPVWTVGVDWNNNGSFNDTGDNISRDALDTSGATIQYGRDQARAMNPVATATMGFLIDNATRTYSPDNTSSPLSPNVLPRRPVQCTAVQNAVTYIKYRGYLETYDVSSQDHVVTVGCTDVLSSFASLTLSTQLYFAVTTGQAIGFILDALGWTGGRDLDAGATMIRWWWEEGTDGLTALQKVVDSEGPPAIVYLDETTGNFCFRDRSHRLIRAASNTSQATWADSGTDAVPVFTAPFTYDLGWQGIINSVSIPVDTREESGALSVVWQDSTGGTTSIAPGGTVTVVAQGSDPFTSVLTPDSSTGDWVQQSGSTTATVSRTSGQSVVITYTDGGTGSIISALQLQAYSVPVAHSTQINVSDATSIGQYGVRSLGAVSRVPVWSGLNDSAAIAAMILAQRARRLPVVQVTFAGGGNTLLLTQQLARNLSDRVTVTEFETGLTSVDFFIEQVGHVISAGGAWLTTTFGCEKAPVTSLTGQNAGFEGGIGTWTSGGNATLSGTSAQAHSGASSLSMASQASGNMAAAHCTDPQILTAGVPCIAGTLVQCNAWVRAAVSARSVQSGAAFYNAAGTFLSITYGSTVADSTGAWTQATAQLTAPAGAAWCNARVQVLSTGGAAEVHYVDDVLLATALPFIFNDATYGQFNTGGGFGI